VPGTDLSAARDERSARSTEPEERMPGTGWPWSRVRWVASAVYLAGLALFVWRAGIPTDRLGIYGGILVFLSIMVLGRGWAAWWRMMRDWLPFEAVLIAYDYSRGYAAPYDAQQLKDHVFAIHGVSNDLGLPLHVMFPIRFDQWFGRLFGGDGVMPTTWVQEHFHPGAGVPWYGVLVSVTYSTHFLVMPTVAVVLWIRNRERFQVWMRMVIVLAVAGVTTYFLYPMAPPWLADDGGVFPGPHVGRFTTEGFDSVGLKMVGGIVSQGQYLVNPVAAMPSLHMAYATLVVGFFWWGRRWWQRTLLVLYPLAMGFSLVYGGEHYVVDELFGVVYALTVIAGWRLLRRRRLEAASV
jgi:membrane-associated phospholipid phosphatase